MTIETKYNIGDDVWFMDLGNPRKAKICCIRIHKFIDGDISIWYDLYRNSIPYQRKEFDLFPTKEELIKSL